MTDRNTVYEHIDTERDYQDVRWSAEITETGGKHSVTEWLIYMQDYIDEALHILSRAPEPQATEDATHIVRKITAMGIACLEYNGSYPRSQAEIEFHKLLNNEKSKY